MLNVRTKFQQDVAAMKELATMTSAERRALKPDADLRRKEREVAKTAAERSLINRIERSLLDAHPTVLLAAVPVAEQTRTKLQQLHDTVQETSRRQVLEDRRKTGAYELQGLMRHIFAHYTEEGNILRRRPLTRAQPTTVVPTLQELMGALADEHMHFDVLTAGANSKEEMTQSIARQLQWLIAELGAAKERGLQYEHQYKLLLLDYAEQAEELASSQLHAQELERSLADSREALSAERAHSASNSAQNAAAAAALEERVKELMESNFHLMQGGAHHPTGRASTGAVLPPVRGHKKHSSTHSASIGALFSAAAPLMAETPPTCRSTNGSKNVTPRKSGSLTSPRDVAVVPSTAHRATAGLALDEKERYLTTITNLKKDLDAMKQAMIEAQEEAKSAAGLVRDETERVGIAERAGAAEVGALKQLLQTVRDGHATQLSALEASYAASLARGASQEKTIDALQLRLKESTARLLSLQNLLLSGPSVQTLLMSSAMARPDSRLEAMASLDDLSERITTFADEFSHLSAQDLAAVKDNVSGFLKSRNGAAAQSQPTLEVSGDAHSGGGGEVPQPQSEEPALLVPSARPSNETSHASSSRRKKPTLVDDATQTDGSAALWADGLPSSESFPTVPSATRQRSELQRSEEQPSPVASPTASPTSSAAVAKLKSAASKVAKSSTAPRRPSAVVGVGDGIAESIAVSVGGDDGPVGVSPSTFALPPPDYDDRPNSRSASPVSTKQPSSPLGKSDSSSKVKKSASNVKSGKVPPAKGSRKLSSGGSVGLEDDLAQVQSLVTGPEDEADDASDDMMRKRQKAESDAIKRAASQVQVRGIIGAGDVSSDVTNEIAANLERMTALRKQLSAAAEATFQLQQQLEKEKKAVAEAEGRLSEQAKLHAKDADKIVALQKQVDVERLKSEKLSERVSVLLGDVSDYQEKLHDVTDEKDAIEVELQAKIEELEKVIAKYKTADERTAMIDRERQFLEVCERAIRCLMSAEATSACCVCLSRLTNPITIAPCGHTCCEQCFLLLQSEKSVSLPTDAYDAVQTIFNFRQALVAFHDEEERAQNDFLAGRIPLPPEAKKPPRAPVGYLSRASYVKALTGCMFMCPECDRLTGIGYLQQTRLEELCSKLAYVSSVVTELQDMGKARFVEAIKSSDPNAELALDSMTLVIADKSSKTQKQTYVDLEAPPSSGSESDEECGAS